jgi:hypothetical protein
VREIIKTWIRSPAGMTFYKKHKTIFFRSAFVAKVLWSFKYQGWDESQLTTAVFEN